MPFCILVIIDAYEEDVTCIVSYLLRNYGVLQRLFVANYVVVVNSSIQKTIGG
jgi:hypothetical protein